MGKLIKCKDCGHDVSKNAKACPRCGSPIKADSSLSGCSGCLVVIVLGALIAVCAGVFTQTNSNRPNNSGSYLPVPDVATENKQPSNTQYRVDKLLAYNMMQQYVTNQLKSPSSAKFPSVWDGKDDHVTYQGDKKYSITSWVDSQNGFGAMLRTKWTGTIQEDDQGDWTVTSFALLE